MAVKPLHLIDLEVREVVGQQLKQLWWLFERDWETVDRIVLTP